MRVVLDLLQQAFPLELCHQIPPSLEAILPGVRASLLVERSIIVHDVDSGQTMPLADVKVGRIVTGSHLHCPRPKLWIDRLLGNDGDVPLQDWQSGLLANQRFVPLILRVNGNRCIAEDCLGLVVATVIEASASPSIG